jgi:hypothetical protein
MEKVNIEKSYGADKVVRYYLTHPSAEDSIILTQQELEGLYLQLFNIVLKPKEKLKPQLIIHETDCHGCGNVIYGNEVRSYTYDDGEMGDAMGAVQGLIDIGFIDPNDVTFIEGDEIYQHLNIK